METNGPSEMPHELKGGDVRGVGIVDQEHHPALPGHPRQQLGGGREHLHPAHRPAYRRILDRHRRGQDCKTHPGTLGEREGKLRTLPQ